MDNELFELCKEVYEKTGWNGSTLEKMALSMADSELHSECPLYTSDYLLEKLPATGYKGGILSIKKYESVGDFMYGASYGVFGAEHIADTPLKALLKLTISLRNEDIL